MYLRSPPDELDFNFDPDKTGIKIDVKEVYGSYEEEKRTSK